MVSSTAAKPLYMLDTSVCVDILRGRAPAATFPAEQVTLSVIVVAELWTGLEKMGCPAQKAAQLAIFLDAFPTVDFTADAARHYGQIRAHLEKKGTPIGPMDLLISAHARSVKATLLTHNLGEFKRVPKLKVRAWR